MGDFFEAIGNFFTGGPPTPEYTPSPAAPAYEPAPTLPAAPNYEALYRQQVTTQMAKEKTAAGATAAKKSAKRGATILTGPRGIQDQTVTAGKTLLGA